MNPSLIFCSFYKQRMARPSIIKSCVSAVEADLSFLSKTNLMCWAYETQTVLRYTGAY